VLGGILTLAATSGSVGNGIGLLLVYSAGLAIPFLVAALLLDRFLGGMRRFGRWLPWVSRISGLLLLVLGVLLLTGSFTTLSGILSRWTPDFLANKL
jgi:cytochrome c-type biogenesis protein